MNNHKSVNPTLIAHIEASLLILKPIILLKFFVYISNIYSFESMECDGHLLFLPWWFEGDSAKFSIKITNTISFFRKQLL